MSESLGRGACRLHDWERRLERRHGVDCVIRVCHRCAREELCWSRSPVWLDSTDAEKGGICRRIATCGADQ